MKTRGLIIAPSRPSPRRRACTTLALAVLTVVGGVLPAEARTHRLGLDQVIQLALRHNRQVLMAREQVAGAEAARKSVRGEFGPKLKLDASLTYWDSALPFDLPFDTTNIPPPFDTMFSGTGNLVVRDQLTTQVNVTLAQPLTPLYQVAKGHAIAALGRDAAGQGLRAVRQAIASAATGAYIGVIGARTGASIARTAVEQVTAHVRQAKAFFHAGVASRTDVLKAELALAQAEEGLIKAEAGLSLAQTGLVLVTGLPRGDLIDPTQRFVDPPPPYARSLEQDTREALERRPDLRAVAHKVSISEKSRDLARWEFVPQVVALANYTHSTGAELMAPANTFFVGGMLKWDIWEWGAKYYKLQQAKHELARERLGHKEAAAGVVLDVKKAYLELLIAEKTLRVAKKGVTVAEEAYRIEQAKFERNAATTTDVLDAQLALTRTRLTYSTALFGWYVARAKLSQAVGSRAGR